MAKNPPMKSKINYTGLAIALIGVGAAADFIPKAYEEHLVEIVLILGGPLVMYFRTWKNG